MSKVSNATTENLLSTAHITDYDHVFFNAGTKKYPKESLSLEVTNNKDMNDFRSICEIMEDKTPFKYNKDNTKLYVKFGLSNQLKVFNDKKKEINDVDIEELLKTKDTRIIFTVNKYKMNGESGLSFRAQQIQVKDKENKFKECIFDD